MLEIFRKRNKLSKEASVPQTSIVHKSYNVDTAQLNGWRKENQIKQGSGTQSRI